MRERGKMQRMRVRSRPMSENELEQEQGRVNMRVRIEQRLKGRREEYSGDKREGWEDCEDDKKIAEKTRKLGWNGEDSGEENKTEEKWGRWGRRQEDWGQKEEDWEGRREGDTSEKRGKK